MSSDCSVFYVKYRNKCVQPLADCLEWAQANCTQKTADNVEVNLPMLMFVRMESRDTYVERRYFAATPSHFERMFARARNDADRHYHEIVVDGPVKLFLDLEMYMTDVWLKKYRCATPDELRKRCEQSAAALIGYIVAWHKREHRLAVTPIVNTSHKESKWTIHVTFDGAVWRDNMHCKHFILGIIVKQALRDPMLYDLVDKGIYERNHPMRTYRSTKNDEPERSILGPDEKPDSPIDIERLRRSLITCIKIYVPAADDDDDDEHDDNDDKQQQQQTQQQQQQPAAPKPPAEIYLSTMFMRLHITEPEVFGIKYISCPGYTTNRLLNSTSFSNGIGSIKYIESIVDTHGRTDEDHQHGTAAATSSDTAATADTTVIGSTQRPTAAVASKTKSRGLTDELTRRLIAYFAPYLPVTLKIDVISGLVVVACKSRECMVKGGAHKRNHIYIIVDIYRQTWALRCHDDECKAILAQSPIQWNMLPADMESECEASRLDWAREMPRMFTMLNGRRSAAAAAVATEPIHTQSND